MYVPLGTVVTLHKEDAADDGSDWIRMFNRTATTADVDDDANAAPATESIDLLRNGEEILVAKGGRGGTGNRSSQVHVEKHRPAGQASAKGRPGETVKVDIELKVLADVGLVGYPNAGKSTLLAALSNAKPKVDSYAFTTLSPNLGVVEKDEDRLTIADIPGLVEGAHRNRGLGHDFLRHIERTKVCSTAAAATNDVYDVLYGRSSSTSSTSPAPKIAVRPLTFGRCEMNSASTRRSSCRVRQLCLPTRPPTTTGRTGSTT